MIATISLITKREMIRAEFPLENRSYHVGDVAKTIDGVCIKVFDANKESVVCAPVFLLDGAEKFVQRLQGRITQREDLCPPPVIRHKKGNPAL